MSAHRIAIGCAVFAIVACASIMPWSSLAATPSTRAISDMAADATEKRKPQKTKSISKSDASTQHRGLASYYSKYLAGNKTSSGERYDPNAMTAAHRSLPMGTRLKVVNPRNDKSVVVTVNDRGPVPKNRMIDLSGAAAKELGMTKAGITRVETEVLGKSDAQSKEGATK